jgi:uncharacterized protein YndB with AHSA1/START domain
MIAVNALVGNASIATVWNAWISPQHIVQWYFASPDWCCPSAEMDCRVGGTFNLRMEAKDQSFGFDFKATFTEVDEFKSLKYTLEDGRLVVVTFLQTAEGISITWEFEPERQNSEALQKQGWQAILNHFKKYLEHSVVV